MKIGIGIDTGGTCTDAVVYDLEKKEILAVGKTATTKDNLVIGIGKALDTLPAEMLAQAKVVALSTTLATNACIENKGGRGKLIFLGVDPENVKRIGKDYGLSDDDSLIFVDSKSNMTDGLIREPDWAELEKRLDTELEDCQAVGIVELFANRTGAVLEKKVRRIIEEKYQIPVACGYELFSDLNAIGRGAGVLLNVRLITLIQDFLKAVKSAMKVRNILAPVVIVRSDGSLMPEEVAKKRPVETLLCGPVASVKGAAELCTAPNALVVDMGGTTTDISMVRNGVPLRQEGGIRIGQWATYVQGLYVDTFGLGGDSGISLDVEGKLSICSQRVMPLCMASVRYPSILDILKEQAADEQKKTTWRKRIYVGLRDISEDTSYTEAEREIGRYFYENPMSFIGLEQRCGRSLHNSLLDRLLRENVIMPCGITPTDAMHVKGDFHAYHTEASLLGIRHMAYLMECTEQEVCEKIYELVREKLFMNIARILLAQSCPVAAADMSGDGWQNVLREMYRQKRYGKRSPFGNISINTDMIFVGVGGPIHLFLQDVAELFGTEAEVSTYARVANALGAIVGNVAAEVTLQIQAGQIQEGFLVTGNGVSYEAENLEAASQYAEEQAIELAKKEAIRRGAAEHAITVQVVHRKKEAALTQEESIFIEEKVTATVKAAMELK